MVRGHDDWGLSADQRFSRAYELEEYRALPEPTGGYEGQPYHYNAQATVYYVPVHRDVNESSIAKYGDTVDSFVTGVVNPGESYLERGGAWNDWSAFIAEGKNNGTLVSHYDYDNFPLKAYADAEDRAAKPAATTSATSARPGAAAAAPSTGDPVDLRSALPLAAIAAAVTVFAARARKRE